MREKTCCFTGHRNIPPEELEGIRQKLETTILSRFANFMRRCGADLILRQRTSPFRK